MTSRSSLVAGNLFHVGCMRPPVPGCGGVIGNDPTTVSKSSFFSEPSPSLTSSLLSTSQTVASPTSHKPALLQEPDGCTSSTDLRPEVCEPGMSKMDSLICLLNDHHGITFFRQFLAAKRACDVLDFWLACMGHRKSDVVKCSSIATAIYKKFIAPASNRVHLTGATRRAIKERLKSGSTDHTLFDNAVMEVETFLLRHHYPLFLESDDYAEYVRTRSASHSPSSDSSCDYSSVQNQLRTAETADRHVCNRERSCKHDFCANKTPEDRKNHASLNFRCNGDFCSQTGYVLFILFSTVSVHLSMYFWCDAVYKVDAFSSAAIVLN